MEPRHIETLTANRMISGPRVDVYVGPNKKQYNVPKLLLWHYSDFFDRCFNGKFAEAQSQKVDLPEDNVEDFEILLEFMLRGTSPGSLKVTEVSALNRSFSMISQYFGNNLPELFANSLVTDRQTVRLFSVAWTSSLMQTNTTLLRLPKSSTSH